MRLTAFVSYNRAGAGRREMGRFTGTPYGQTREVAGKDSPRRLRCERAFRRAVCALMAHLGFEVRVRGSHHIFTKDGVAEILNLQPRGSQAKPYQVKRVRNVILKYRLTGHDDGKI